MSNLKLPSLNYYALERLISTKPWRGSRIGYNTRAEGYSDGSIGLTHHHNDIGRVFERDGRIVVHVRFAGWNSRTTADRMNRLVRDNLGADSPYSVRIHDGILSVHDSRKRGESAFTALGYDGLDLA